MVSRISLLAIVDMLYMGVLLSDYETFTTRLNRVNKLVESKNY
jgi:DNA-binding MurR/RpiR family transcriptional regulator